MRLLFPTAISILLGLSAHGNVLLNPGFETDNASGGDAIGATDWITFNEAYTSETQARSGVNSLKLFGQGFAGSTAGAIQSAPVVADDIWEFKAWAFVPSGEPITGTDFAVLKLEFFDGADPGSSTLIQELESGLNVDVNTPQDVWTEFSVSAIAPPGALSVQAVIVFVVDTAVPTAGAVFFDDADLAKTGTAVPVDPGVLTNGSFEADDASGGDVPAATGWQVFDPGARFTTSNVSNYGLQSVKMFGPFVEDGGQAVYQDSPAAPFDIWTASASGLNFKSDRITGNNFATVQLQFLDASDNALATFGSAIVDENSPLNEWIGLSVSGTAPAGTAKARILLLHVQLAPVSGGAIHFDDASLAKTGEVEPPLEIVNIARSGSTVSVEFQSAADETYALVKSTSLDSLPLTWTPVQSGIVGTGGVLPAADSSATEAKAFYAIVKQLPPS